MNHTKTTSLVIIIALFTALAGTGVFFAARSQSQTAPPHEETALDDGKTHKEEKSVDGHDHGAEVSDLDRPVDEMWAARCEHDILQHQCDECRYEIGMVKLDAGLMGDNGLVRTGFPEKQQGRHEEHILPGEVQLDETRTVHVASPLTGLITRGFTMPGTQVEVGAPLFEVDSPEVAEAKGSYLKAKAGLDFARKAAEREALLFSKKVAAQVEVQEAEAKQTEAETEIATARGRLLRLGLRAGTVIEGHTAPGEYAETGKELLTISALDKIWIMADLKEIDLAAVSGAVGGEAKVDALGRSFTGKLDTIAGRMSEETRTAKARFSVDNTDALLKPGMFVSVRLLLPAAGETLVVPKVAVLADEGRTFVFTHKDGDYWVRRPVTLGARFDDLVEITSGITAGQRIITDGSFLLKSDVLRGKMGAGCAD